MMILTKRPQVTISLFATLICTFFLGLGSPPRASDPHSAVYSGDDQKIFWFVIVSDTHIGARGLPGNARLEWLVSHGREVINPSFIVNTGDMTDSTAWSDTGYPDGPHESEWTMYRSILDRNGIDATFYYDIPGNHDLFGVEGLSYYLDYSIQGSATGQPQFSWTREFPFGTYHFLGINTCGNDGADFSFEPPFFGDNAGLDSEELDFIELELEANKNAELTMIFGHHLLFKRETDWSYVAPSDVEESTMTALRYGANPFVTLMNTYHPLMYAYGHSHVYREEFLTKDMDEGVIYLNVASMTHNDEKNYNIVALDNNGISTKAATIGVWPAVIITAPLDKNLGMRNNPYTSGIEDLSGDSTPIRALVFVRNDVERVDYRMYKIGQRVGDVVGIAIEEVTGRVDDEDMWFPMTQVSDPGHPAYPYLWTADCANPLQGGDYIIEVRARGTTTQRDAVPTSFPADPVSGEGCFITAIAHSR